MAYLDSFVLLPPVRDATLTQIYNVISHAKSVANRDQGTFWIKSRVEIAWPSSLFWHMACPHCYELYEFSSTLGIICLSCGQGMHEFPRYVNVIALGPEAEHLIGLCAADMYRVSDHQTFEISKRVSRQIDGKELLCYLKYSSKMIRTTTHTNYTIVACYPTSGNVSS
ncbi:uncharacterized protein [Coffea arabica]|uniref:Uncharacterized protein n=1 Tax=Coffea arabica TaxID=13443 RepID=A0ABM4VAX5_COFAR